MSLIAKHILIDYTVADEALLTVPAPGIAALREAVIAGGATVLKQHEHKFEPGGYTGFLLLAQSHASIHTWPEESLVSIDVFACGEISETVILTMLRERFHPTAESITVRRRGLPDAGAAKPAIAPGAEAR